MKKSFLSIVAYAIMIFYTIISLYPVIWMAFYSLKSNEEIFVTNPFGIPTNPQWGNYVEAVEQFDILLYFKNSGIITFFAVILGIFFSLTFTYVVARVKNDLTRGLRAMVMAGMFIPIQAVMVPLITVLKNLGLINTYASLILPYMVIGFPFAIMVLYGFYVNLPIELEESAYIEGAGFFRTFFQIILPLMKTSISVLAIYQFMNSWNEFSLALVLITKTSMRTIALWASNFTGGQSVEWGIVGACLVMASAPVVILYLFFSNQISDAMAHSGMKN